MIVHDITAYRENAGLLNSPTIYLVVKSLDQLERRKRMIESKKQGTIGRIAPRPVAEALLVKADLQANKTVNLDNAILHRRFKEPRGLVKVDEHHYLLTEISRVLLIRPDGHAVREFTHPYFAFLHSVDYDPTRRAFLVVSSGYDSLFECSLETGEVLWTWFAWDHGFIAPDGTYLTHDPRQAENLRAQGYAAKYIDPQEYGEQGLLTSTRTNHPNSACYHPHDPHKVIVTLGHSGEIIEIDKRTGGFVVKLGGLDPMPHAILPYDDGWIVTNTLRGEWWLLNGDFRPTDKFVTANLPGKVAEAGEHEWLQAVYPLGDGLFVGIDANRGLIVFSPSRREYTVVECDENWCVQQVLAA